MASLRLVFFVQGWYGERIARHVSTLRPDWPSWVFHLGRGFPRLPDDDLIRKVAKRVSSEMPGEALEPDIAVFLLEEAGACLLIPELAGEIGAGSVLVPVDDYKLVPRGLERQLSEELLEMGIPSSFPRPFCSLSKGPGPIGVFASSFGLPELEIEVKDGLVRSVRVLRGAPCGSTHHMASRLVGVPAREAPRLAGLYVQTYPCLASHARDPVIGEDMIGLSATLAKRAVERSLGVLR